MVSHMKISNIIAKSENYYKKALWNYFLVKTAQSLEEEGYDDDFNEEEMEDYIAQQYAQYMTDERYAPVTKSILREEEEEKEVEKTTFDIPKDTIGIIAALKDYALVISNPYLKQLITNFINKLELLDKLLREYTSKDFDDDTQLASFDKKINKARGDFIDAFNNLNNSEEFKNPKEEEWKNLNINPSQLSDLINAAGEHAFSIIYNITGETLDLSDPDYDPRLDKKPSEISEIFAEISGDSKAAAAEAKERSKVLNKNKESAKNYRKRLQDRIKTKGINLANLTTEEFDAYAKEMLDAVTYDKEKKQYEKALRVALRDWQTINNILKSRKELWQKIKENPLLHEKEKARKAALAKMRRGEISAISMTALSVKLSDLRKHHEMLKKKVETLRQERLSDEKYIKPYEEAKNQADKILEEIIGLTEEYKIRKDRIEQETPKRQVLNKRYTERRGVERHVASAGNFIQVLKSMGQHESNVEWGDVKSIFEQVKDNIIGELDRDRDNILTNLEENLKTHQYAKFIEIWRGIVIAKTENNPELGKTSLKAMADLVSNELRSTINEEDIFATYKSLIKEKVDFVNRTYNGYRELYYKLLVLEKEGIIPLENEELFNKIEKDEISADMIQSIINNLTQYSQESRALSAIPILTFKGKMRKHPNPILGNMANAIDEQIKRFTEIYESYFA